MRLVACAVSILALAAAGCGSDTAVNVVWGGPPEPGPGGVVSVDGFASFQRDVDEHLSFLKRYFEVSADTPEKKKRAEEVIAIAEGIYADREEVEAEWYAS